MSTRFNMAKVQPEAYEALTSIDRYVAASQVGERQQELIRIRASQINGCAYCVNMHTKHARKLGETEQRIYLINVWREAGNVFTEDEQVIFAITEEVTLIHRHGLSQGLYEQGIALFGEKQLAQILMVIITINAWNRLGVSLQLHPVASV